MCFPRLRGILNGKDVRNVKHSQLLPYIITTWNKDKLWLSNKMRSCVQGVEIVT